jgi:hypothetical protein
MKLQPGMIDAAIVGGVRHFYPSEWGTDIARGDIGKNRYFRDKVSTREHLYTLLMTGAFTEFAPSWLLANKVKFFFDAVARPSATAQPDNCLFSSALSTAIFLRDSTPARPNPKILTPSVPSSFSSILPQSWSPPHCD